MTTRAPIIREKNSAIQTFGRTARHDFSHIEDHPQIVTTFISSVYSYQLSFFVATLHLFVNNFESQSRASFLSVVTVGNTVRRIVEENCLIHYLVEVIAQRSHSDN